MSVFNPIIFFSTANGKNVIAVKHLLSGSMCTNVQLTVAWEKGKVKGKKEAKGTTSPSQLMRTRCSPELPGIRLYQHPEELFHLYPLQQRAQLYALILAQMIHGKTPAAQLEAVVAKPMWR